MKTQTATIMTGLAALMAAGITAQAQNSLTAWPPFGRHCKLGGSIVAQPQYSQTTLDSPPLAAPDERCTSPYVFAEVADPLAVEAEGGTFADGIYGDEIVGVYFDSNGDGHGYVYNDHNQTWTTLDDPLSVFFSGNYDIWENDIIGPYLDSE